MIYCRLMGKGNDPAAGGDPSQYQHQQVNDPFPQQVEQIQPRNRRPGLGQGGNEIDNFLNDKSSLQESVFVDQRNPEAQNQINS